MHLALVVSKSKLLLFSSYFVRSECGVFCGSDGASYVDLDSSRVRACRHRDLANTRNLPQGTRALTVARTVISRTRACYSSDKACTVSP